MQFRDTETNMRKSRDSLTTEQKTLENGRGVGVVGHSRGNEIWLGNSAPIEFVRYYWHESGHVIGRALRFQKGEVLTPDETKVTIPNLATWEISNFLYLVTTKDSSKGLERTLQDVADKVLDTYTRGNFDLHTIILHTNVQPEEFVQLNAKSRERVVKGNAITHRYSKDERNNEVAAITVEAGCMQLLENAIKRIDSRNSAGMGSYSAPSHYAAYRIVERAFKRTGMMPPSVKDKE